MNIYLYIKQHSITGIKYFGKTIQDPYTYIGSGKRWLNHINTHGREHVITTAVWKFDCEDAAKKFAINFSIKNNIVEDFTWANLQIENGIDGAPIGHIIASETKRKISEAKKGQRYGPHNENTKQKMRAAAAKRNPDYYEATRIANLGKKASFESRQKMSEAHKGRTASPETKEKMKKAQQARRINEQSAYQA